MRNTPNLSLIVWDSGSDEFASSDLAHNWDALDAAYTQIPDQLESHSSLPGSGNFDGRTIYLTTAGGGLPAKSIVRYDGATWKTVGPNELFSVLPTSGNYQGRVVTLLANNGGFLANDVVLWNGSAWQQISAPPLLTTTQFNTIPTPADGYTATVQVDATNGVNWQFRYRAGSSSAYKWEFVGGPSLYSELTTSEGTSSATYVALTTGGPAITIPRAGDYQVTIGCRVSIPTGTCEGYMSYGTAGATSAADADSVRFYGGSNSDESSISRRRVKTGLTISQVLTSGYKRGSVSGTVNFAERWMEVLPIRIS